MKHAPQTLWLAANEPDVGETLHLHANPPVPKRKPRKTRKKRIEKVRVRDRKRAMQSAAFRLAVRRCLQNEIDACVTGHRGMIDGQKSHHLAWEAAHGPLPRGVVVFRECRTKGCINPWHLLAGNARHRAEAMNRLAACANS